MASNADDQPKVKLYWLDNSRAQRILWLLEELKIDYELEVFHRDKKTMLAPPELEKVHPLGKSPVITVTPAASVAGPDAKPVVLAESGFMAEYLCEHFPEGKKLLPTRWREGMEGKVGGETDEWLRCRYFVHYNEGSLMPLLVMALVISRLKSNQVPFLVRPITSIVADRIFSMFVFPNIKRHIAMLDKMLASNPSGPNAKFLCSDSLTVADILMSFPLIAAKGRLDEMGSWDKGSWKKAYPRVWEYTQLLQEQDGYKKSVEKIIEIDGKFEESLDM